MKTIILIISLTILAASFNACMDTLQFHYNDSIFSTNEWFNPNTSWKNKYKQPFDEDVNAWYYLGLYTPTYKEAFPYSATALVWSTDGWHLFQMLFLTSFQLLICLLLSSNIKKILLYLVIQKIIFGLIFELFFKTILVC